MKRIIFGLLMLIAILSISTYAKTNPPKLGVFNTSTPCIVFNLTFGVDGIVRLAGTPVGGAVVSVYSEDWSQLCYQTTTIKGGSNNGRFFFPNHSFYSDIFTPHYCWHIGYRSDNYTWNSCEIMYDPGPPDHILPMQFSLR